MGIFCIECHTEKVSKKIRIKLGSSDEHTMTGVCYQCDLGWKLKLDAQKEDVLRLTVKRKKIGRPQKPFAELSSYTKRVRVRKAIETLREIEGGALEPLLQAVSAKVGVEKKSEESQLKENIAFFATHYLPQLPETSRSAAALTQGLLLREASELTGIPPSSLCWGKKELDIGNVYGNPDPVVPHPANEAKEDERKWFQEFSLGEAPVYSGSLKTRRLRQNSYANFYVAYLESVQKTKFSKRSLNCITGWLHELDLKTSSFDRYRCETCHDGREAELKIKAGDNSEESLKEKEKYDKHRRIVENQTRVCKEIKDGRTKKQLIMIFDYSTVHERSDEKVRIFFCFLFFGGVIALKDHKHNPKRK